MSQETVSWKSLFLLYLTVAATTGLIGAVLVGLGVPDSLILVVILGFIGTAATLHVWAPRDSPARLWAGAKSRWGFEFSHLRARGLVLVGLVIVLISAWAWRMLFNFL
jgi:hypothetical protein